MSSLIDVHAHWFPPQIVEKFDALGGMRVWPAHPESLTERVDSLQEVDGTQILSLGHNQPAFADEGSTIESVVFANDLYAEAVRSNTNLEAFGSVPLPYGAAAVTEARRVLEDLGLAGINVGTTALGSSLDDPEFSDLWAYLDEKEAVVFVHPVDALGKATGFDKYLMGPNFGGPTEVGIAAVRLLVDGFPTRFPRIKWILAPMGGTLSLLWRRFEDISLVIGHEQILGADPIAAMRYFWYDTTLTDEPKALAFATDMFGSDRIVFGSDAPRVNVADWKSRVTAGFSVAESELNDVFYANASALLK